MKMFQFGRREIILDLETFSIRAVTLARPKQQKLQISDEKFYNNKQQQRRAHQASAEEFRFIIGWLTQCLVDRIMWRAISAWVKSMNARKGKKIPFDN